MSFAENTEAANIGAITMLAPVLDYRRVFIRPESDWGRSTFPPEAISACIEKGEPIALSETFFVGPRLLASMLHSNVMAEFARLGRPITVIHGDHDGMVSIGISRDAAAAYRNIRLIEFSNMEHGFTDAGDETGQRDATQTNVRNILEILISGAK